MIRALSLYSDMLAQSFLLISDICLIHLRIEEYATRLSSESKMLNLDAYLCGKPL